MVDISKYGLEKRVVANECVALLSVLPRHQIERMSLEWLRMRDLRRLYKEIKKTYNYDMNKINLG